MMNSKCYKRLELLQQILILKIELSHRQKRSQKKRLGGWQVFKKISDCLK